MSIIRARQVRWGIGRGPTIIGRNCSYWIQVVIISAAPYKWPQINQAMEIIFPWLTDL